MFSFIYPHKMPFKIQKDEEIFNEMKAKLRKFNIEALNIYCFDDKNSNEKRLMILTKNSLGIIPDNDFILTNWYELAEKHDCIDKAYSKNMDVVFANSEALALEKTIRDEKNKIYVSKIVNKNLKVNPYKVFAFTTNKNNNPRTCYYSYTSGYNIIFETKEEYEAALQKEDVIVNLINKWINKLTGEALHRKTSIYPVIRFLYKELITDIDEMDKENSKQF